MGRLRAIVLLLLAGSFASARAQCDALVIDTVLPADTSVCSGASMQFEAFGTFPDSTGFQWQELIADVWTDLPNDTDSVLIATPTDTTFYRVIAACTAEADTSDPVRVTVRALPTSTNSGSVSYCGTTADTVLYFFGGGTGPWEAHFSTPGGPVDIVVLEDTFDIPIPLPGSYFLDSLSMAACLGNELGDTVHITLIDAPSAVILSPDTVICSDGTANLVANDPGGSTGLWTLNGSTDPQISVVSDSTATFDPMLPEEYLIYWTVSAAGCPADSDSVVVTVVQAAAPANAGEDANICANSTMTLAGSPPTPGTGEWTVVSSPSGAPDPITDPNDPSTTFAPAMSGTYTLRWTVAAPPCGTTQDDVTIQVVEAAATPAILDFGDTDACDGEYQTLAIGNPVAGTTYTWSCADWAVSPVMSDTVTVLWEFPADSTVAFTSQVIIVANGTCPDTTPLEIHLSPSAASCPRGIVYFEPHGLAVLDATANYFQWGTLDADSDFLPDSERTEQTTFVPGLSACDSSDLVVRTSISGSQCWSTTLACATQEMLDRACPTGDGMVQEPQVRIYPNPSNGGPVTLEAIGNETDQLIIDVTDLNGRTLSHGTLRMNGTSTMTLNLERLDRGIYVLRAWNTEMDRTIKLVID